MDRASIERGLKRSIDRTSADQAILLTVHDCLVPGPS